MSVIKTHFNYTDDKGEIYQVALGFLPYVPRKGENISFISQNKETNFWNVHLKFKVKKVSYELFGTRLPVSGTWENLSNGSGCNVVIDVLPQNKFTLEYIEEIITIQSANFPSSRKNIDATK